MGQVCIQNEILYHNENEQTRVIHSNMENSYHYYAEQKQQDGEKYINSMALST